MDVNKINKLWAQVTKLQEDIGKQILGTEF